MTPACNSCTRARCEEQSSMLTRSRLVTLCVADRHKRTVNPDDDGAPDWCPLTELQE